MEIYSKSNVAPAESAPVQKKEPGLETQTTSAGIAAQGGVAPDPLILNFQLVAASLSQFFPSLTGEQIDILIAEATLKLQEVVGKTNTTELVAQLEQKRESLTERSAKFAEAQLKQEEAASKQDRGGFFSRLKTAFQAIGAAITIGIGVALAATGVGAPLAGPLIAMGALQMLLVIDSIVAQHNDGVGIGGLVTGSIARALEGVGLINEEQVEKAEKVGTIAFQVHVSIAIVATAVMTGRVDQAGAAIPQAVAAISGAVTTITTSSLAIKSATVTYQAANRQAEAQDLRANAQELQAFTELLNDFVDQILNRISNANTQFNGMLDDLSQSVKDRGDTLARANFTG